MKRNVPTAPVIGMHRGCRPGDSRAFEITGKEGEKKRGGRHTAVRHALKGFKKRGERESTWTAGRRPVRGNLSNGRLKPPPIAGRCQGKGKLGAGGEGKNSGPRHEKRKDAGEMRLYSQLRKKPKSGKRTTFPGDKGSIYSRNETREKEEV